MGIIKKDKQLSPITPKGPKKPSPYVSEPKHVTIPLEIRSVREPLTVQIVNANKQWMHKRKTNTQTMNNKCNLQVCKWYRQKRALKKLKKIQQLEKNYPLRTSQDYAEQLELEKQLFEKARREKLEKLQAKAAPAITYTYDEKKAKRIARQERKARERYEQEQRRLEREHARRIKKENVERAKKLRKQAKYNKDDNIKVETRVRKQKKYKPKKTYTSPKTVAKTVYAKREIVYQEPLANRFTNCFYKFCCQLYCYLTFFIILGFVVIVLI